MIELTVILLLVLLNGFLALAEMAVVSARKARLQAQADAGDARAKAAMELSENPSMFLSTVQVGITLVGILAGAVGGATVGEQLGVLINQVSWLAPYGSFLGIFIVVVFVTYLSLVVGELVPKRIALNDPERYARLVAHPMQVLERISAPLVSFLSHSTEAVIRLLRVRPVDEPEVTEEEIKILIDQGTQAGVITMAEKDMLRGVFRLADRRVGTLLTPRMDIVWLDLEDAPELNWQKVVEAGHSHFPVGRGSLDEVVGVLQAKRLLDKCLQGSPMVLEELIDDPIVIPESMPAFDVLEIFDRVHLHMALVIDEFGGLQGLVTINDILQAIVGEALVAKEFQETEIVMRDDGSWLIDGMLPVDELKELLEIGQLPGEELARYQTVGGMVMTYLGRIPAVGDLFTWLNFTFEVVDMDGMRVDKVLVQPPKHNHDSNGNS